MSLRLRLALAFGLFSALIIGLFSFALYVATRQSLEVELDRRLQARANLVELTIWPDTEALTSADLGLARLDLPPQNSLFGPILYVQVLSRDSEVLAISETLRGATLPIDQSSVGAALAGEQAFADVRVNDGGSVRVLSAPISLGPRIVGILQVGQSRQAMLEALDRLRTQLQLLGIALLILACLGGWFLSHRLLQSLTALTRQAAALAARRDFSRRLRPRNRNDEVGQLALTIDRLLAVLEETTRMNRNLVGSVSQELRNPLLALRGNLDLLQRVQSDEARRECLAEASQQVERMSRMISDLLELAPAEAAERPVERRLVDLRPLLQQVAHQSSVRARGQRIQVEVEDDVMVPGDEGRLSQAVTNLVDNALGYTPSGATITLRLGRDEGWARVSVEDPGAGNVAPVAGVAGTTDGVPTIVSGPGPVERRGSSSGNGAIGLAVVKQLVEEHGGRVTLESELGGGSRYTVWLPVRAEPPSPGVGVPGPLASRPVSALP